MKRLALLLMSALLTGCTLFQSPSPVPVTDPGPPPASAPVKEEPAPQQPAIVVVPTPEEICLKPEDKSGISFVLYKPQGDSSFLAKPGWVISRPSFQILGSVIFPRDVDPASVKLSIEPAGAYQLTPARGQNVPESMVLFHFMPVGSDISEPLLLQWGQPGWVTITLEGAKDKQGALFVDRPLTLKIFAYDMQMADAYPYLTPCYSSLSVPPGPGGL